MNNTPPEKPKPKTRKKELAGTQSAFLAPVPRSIEKFTDAGGERFTRLIFDLPFTAPVTHSADRFFADAQNIPAMLTNPWVWLIIKPWLDNDPSEVDAFFKQFNTQEAAQERVRAKIGRPVERNESVTVAISPDANTDLRERVKNSPALRAVLQKLLDG